MSMEIAIHRSVGQNKGLQSETHKHIVGFHGFFEDSDYIYILLELCRRRVSKRRWHCQVDVASKTLLVFFLFTNYFMINLRLVYVILPSPISFVHLVEQSTKVYAKHQSTQAVR